jgi:DNA-binding response OmpR family regulator
MKSEIARPRTVLLVEDDDDVRELLSGALEQAGYELDCARTYAEAQHAITHGQHDLVVTDVRLPDGKGYDLLARARAAGCKVIFISGQVSHMPSAEASRVICLTKPFRVEALLDTIQAELG